MLYQYTDNDKETLITKIQNIYNEGDEQMKATIIRYLLNDTIDF